eukprot:UN16584
MLTMCVCGMTKSILMACEYPHSRMHPFHLLYSI